MSRAGRKTKWSAVAAVAAMALTGCGALHPGVAAVVGSHTISDQKVDDVARALCSANSAGAPGSAPVATRAARQGALQVLLDSELSRQFGEQKGVTADKAVVSQTLAQNEAGISQLPAGEQDDYRAALKEFKEGGLMLTAIGRQSLESQNKTNITDDQALAEGSRLRNKYTNGLDVKVDPRYGTFTDDTLHPGGSDLSVAVSARAADGASPDPSNGWVASLPTSQQCS